MAKIQLTVCDLDPSELGKETQHYTVTTPAGRSELDLCKDHSEPIESLLKQAYGDRVAHPAPAKKAAAKKTTTPRRRTSGSKIMTLEEIEAMKTS
ncbi:hypothetical protein Joe_31 [Streptomyces phage Joe]|uniref:Lsr2-like DNA bridging protein n=1 Tax=Streptomyces phage Joe TaxID=1913034 RepID=A0A1J0GQ83_9CAUD|nr:hypothetical protein KGG94_gp31 [Streptomyces phage Joe]APC43271.1 hypothetical protein Joe_31 [Streptomyces phage Joe]